MDLSIHFIPSRFVKLLLAARGAKRRALYADIVRLLTVVELCYLTQSLTTIAFLSDNHCHFFGSQLSMTAPRDSFTQH